MKIYIDTNIYVDFYQAATDPVGAFDELITRSDVIVCTRQTINEFSRNRARVISKTTEEFKKSAKINPYTTALLRHMKEFQDVIDARDALKGAADALVAVLDQILDDTAIDPVFRKYLDLLGRIPIFETTELIFRTAHRRKLLGEPPSSESKPTIGDEVIWESLLANIKEDLVLVTRDNSFHENRQFLEAEFKIRTGKKLLLVTKQINEALRLAGKQESPKLEIPVDPPPPSPPKSAFSQFRERSRESGPRGNLLALYVRQESFRAEHDRYGSTTEEIDFTAKGSEDWEFEVTEATADTFLARASPRRPELATFFVDETGRVRREES